MHILGQICGLSLHQRRLAPDRTLLGNQENGFLAHGEPNECLEKHSSVDKTGKNLNFTMNYKRLAHERRSTSTVVKFAFHSNFDVEALITFVT